MISVEDCVSIEVSNLRNYVEKSQERLLIIVRQEEILGEGKEKKVIQNIHKESYKQKVLHGQFYKNTEKVRDPLTWDWLKKGYLKKETEGMIMAAQDQALRTRYIRKELWNRKEGQMEGAFKSQQALNFGIGGDRTQNVLWRVENGEIPSNLQICVIHCGTNNIDRDSPLNVTDGIVSIASAVQSKKA